MDPSGAATLASCDVGGGAGAVFAQLMATLMHAQCVLADRSAYPADTAQPLPEYDFVVVGAGSAGSAVAARLSENPSWRVLLLEAGGDPPPTSDVPRLFPTLQNTEADWSYRTEPDGRACLGNVDERCAWPRGKALGGSSVINAMMYIRGNAQDYDRWAALGNEGWSYKDVLPFFKKLESFDEKELQARPHTVPFHGRSGPIQVSKPPSLDPAQDALNAAAKELGYKIIEDYSSEPNVGFGQVHCSIKNGTRWNAARGYLGPAKDRENLHVIKFAYTTKVLIDTRTQTAYGVQYLKDGKKREVRATKEVILSAGAINTPHILMNSGIGPKEHLEEVGVPVIKDLRVGYNLQDHIIYTGLYYVRKPSQMDLFVESAVQYLVNRTGVLSTTGISTYTGFIQTEKAPRDGPGLQQVDPTNYPDVQFHYLPVEAASVKLASSFFYYNDEVTDAMKNMVENDDALLVVPTLVAPTSRGRIKLKSADPLEVPLIDSGYYADPRDLDNLLAGVEFAYRMGNTEAMRAAGFTVKDLPLKACSDRPPLSPEYWRCAAPYLTTTLYHPVGTAKMGPADDADAVVDPSLHVHGVRNLRVADASIMPVLVRCNTNVPSIMIGEKCAHMVTEEWKNHEEKDVPKSEL